MAASAYGCLVRAYSLTCSKKDSANDKMNHRNKYVQTTNNHIVHHVMDSDTEERILEGPRRDRYRLIRKRRRREMPSPAQGQRKKARRTVPVAWTVENVGPSDTVSSAVEPSEVPLPADQVATFEEVSFDEDLAPSVPPLNWSAFDTSPPFERCSLFTLALAQLGFYMFLILSYLNRLLFPHKVTEEKNREGYAPLYNAFDEFFSHHVYRRGRHCYNRPVSSAPHSDITLMERTSDDYNWTFRLTGRELKCVNLGSYNYLGYRGGKDEVKAATRRYGISLSSSRAELGSCPLHAQLESELADFLGVEAAMVVGNGFSANSLTLPGLLSPGTLVLSDEKNHASLRVGLRLVRVAVRVFRHNDMRHLEKLARKARAEGRWKKIVIMLEGVYSMEGSVAALPAAIALKKQLGLHLYVDEAHSIGLGPQGRGVTDMWGVNPKDVDVLMGTFTKSFVGMGGYIAGSSALVNRVRAHGHAHAYAQSMSPPIAAHVLSALRDLRAPSGQARVAALRDNTRYFRERLRAMGVVIYGHPQSPVVPMMVYSVAKMCACVERLTAAGVAAVGVCYPATPLYQARMRFCLSAAHTREQLDKALTAIEAVVDDLGLRYSRLSHDAERRDDLLESQTPLSQHSQPKMTLHAPLIRGFDESEKQDTKNETETLQSKLNGTFHSQLPRCEVYHDSNMRDAMYKTKIARFDLAPSFNATHEVGHDSEMKATIHENEMSRFDLPLGPLRLNPAPTSNTSVYEYMAQKTRNMLGRFGYSFHYRL